MQYNRRYDELNALFKMGKDVNIVDSDINIRFFNFRSNLLSTLFVQEIKEPADKKIFENNEFKYPVFVPAKMKRADKAILLLHGLNERSWSKYLTWAEFLCKQTGKPVILFPIAFHMNRSPDSWSNPRVLQPLLTLRRQLNGEDRSLSFANVALSERISEQPFRFYSSGRQSVSDLTTLLSEIKQGRHELFCENTQIDVFAYSIGAFLSEITIMSNFDALFSDSKLFLFCGGGIFSSMLGESRSIMDKKAFQSLYSYYMSDFIQEVSANHKNDNILESFNRMISPERDQLKRETFFKSFENKLSGISLLHDKVMPYQGIKDAMGDETAASRIELMDFPFAYAHENPFPVNGVGTEEVNHSFQQVFTKAAQFLA
ncbi:MAG: DUF6051 family protein [Paludibacter sp.]|nr:DUF6051 family protein [Paludibacter sp.]